MTAVGVASCFWEGASVRDRTRGPHLRPVLRPTGFAAWWWATIVAAGLVVVPTLRSFELGSLAGVGAAWWVLLGFVLLGELRPIVASNDTNPDGVNVATAFLFAVLLRWGYPLALVSVLLATVIGEWARGKRVYAATFNVAQYSLSYTVAASVLGLAGWSASLASPVTLAPTDLPVVLLACAAYHLTNTLLVGMAVALAERRPVLTGVLEDAGYHLLTTGAVLGLTPLVVVVLGVHWGFLPLLVLPLSLVFATARLAREREARSHHDELTGLANRRRLAAQVARLGTDRHTVHRAALCVLDLDRFKEVNDTFGHAVGDELLRAVANRLQRSVRPGDTVARLGGDEFAVLLELSDGQTLEPVLQRVVRRVVQPYGLSGVRLEIDVSVGVAILPDHGDDLEVLLRRADAAMYRAKAAGEELVRFSDDLERSGPARLPLVADLRRGLLAGELVLHHQPQVAHDGGPLTGVEALVRWQHPELGLLPPDAFLPLVERTSTMRRLTAAVLDRALTEQAAWRRAGLHVPVSVNVSLHDLADPSFADTVAAHLVRHGTPAGQLRLEITEQALVSDRARLVVTLDALRTAGIELSVDDFGTGHASLTRLKRLPVAELKIDRQFVTDLDDRDPHDVAIVRAIVDLAEALGLRTVAEGVETAGQAEVLTGLGCDAIQGWHVARPMPADDLLAWARARPCPSLPRPRLAATTGRGAAGR